MYWRFIIRFLLLTLGFALTTLGLLAWQQINFDLTHIWPLSGDFRAHPVYAMVLGLALIPPTLWEIFVLESRQSGATTDRPGVHEDRRD